MSLMIVFLLGSQNLHCSIQITTMCAEYIVSLHLGSHPFDSVNWTSPTGLFYWLLLLFSRVFCEYSALIMLLTSPTLEVSPFLFAICKVICLKISSESSGCKF